MSGLADVFASLRAMSLLQLLFAFITCSSYALGQGSLVSERARRYAWGAAAAGSVAFVFQSSDWMQASMLLAFAVAGMGVFMASVWTVSLALGFGAGRSYPALDALQAESAALQRGRGALRADPVHSL